MKRLERKSEIKTEMMRPRGRPRKPMVYVDLAIFYRRSALRHIVELARFCKMDSIEQLYASLLVNHIMARRPTLREEWGEKCAELTGIKARQPSRAGAVQSLMMTYSVKPWKRSKTSTKSWTAKRSSPRS
jgi:hypothetical protein